MTSAPRRDAGALPVSLRRFAAVVLVGIAAAACTSGDDLGPVDTSSTTAVDPPNTVLRIGVEAWPTCVNPLTCADDALRQTVLQHVLPRAFEIGPDGEYRPARLLRGTPTATRQDDGTVEVRYRLADAARWADGRPITSTDFVGTWQAVMATPGADTTGYDRIVAVDDMDPTEAVVTLDGPLLDWQELFGGAHHFLLQADAFGESTDLTGQFEDELPMSAGPYRLRSWDPERAVLAATEPWEGGIDPDVDQVRLERVVVDELANAMTYDMLVPEVGSRVGEPDGFSTATSPTSLVLGVWFDQRQPFLDPLENRQALDAVLDRQELAGPAGGSVVTCAGWAPERGPWCEAASTSRSDPDPDVARFVLGLQGWVENADGDLAIGDVALTIPVTHDPAVLGATAMADAVEEAFGDIGISVARREVATATWWGDRTDQDTGVGVFAVDVSPSPRVLDLYGCPEGGPSSVFGDCPPALVDAARALGRMAEGEALDTVGMMGRLVADEVLWIPISSLPARAFVRDGRVTLPDSVSVVGGPLRGLDRFVGDS